MATQNHSPAVPSRDNVRMIFIGAIYRLEKARHERERQEESGRSDVKNEEEKIVIEKKRRESTADFFTLSNRFLILYRCQITLARDVLPVFFRQLYTPPLYFPLYNSQ